MSFATNTATAGQTGRYTLLTNSRLLVEANSLICTHTPRVCPGFDSRVLSDQAPKDSSALVWEPSCCCLAESSVCNTEMFSQSVFLKLRPTVLWGSVSVLGSGFYACLSFWITLLRYPHGPALSPAAWCRVTPADGNVETSLPLCQGH